MKTEFKLSRKLIASALVISSACTLFSCGKDAEGNDLTTENYSSSSVDESIEIISDADVTESEDEDIEENFYLVAYSNYFPESNSLEIFWETDIEKGNFEIFSSEDNVNYVSEGMATDEQEYIYKIINDFEKKYFKVCVTMQDGKQFEAIPFFVLKIDDGYIAHFIDSDEDRLYDIYEEHFGTDINNPDTDEDGLTDYEEIYITDTDPLIYDSFTKGVSDADADSDGDGISNKDELDFGTDPLNIDTDDDGLNDYDEIFVYKTNPLIPDTDEDGIDDGDEISAGLDPLNPETFGYPDAEHVSTVTIPADSDTLEDINTKDSPYILEVEITGSGSIGSNIYAGESGYAYTIRNDSMLGDSFELSSYGNEEIEKVVLKFTIKDKYIDNVLGTYADNEELQGIKRLNVFMYFEDMNMLLPIETFFDVEKNLLYTEVDQLGTFCIMDMEMWFDSLGLSE